VRCLGGIVEATAVPPKHRLGELLHLVSGGRVLGPFGTAPAANSGETMADPIQQIYAKRELELRKKLKKYKAPPPYQFHASGLAKCKTALYYWSAGYIPAMEDPKSTGYSDDGDMHHDQVRNKLKEAGIKVSGVSFNRDGTVKENTSKVMRVKYKDVEFTVSMRLDGFIRVSLKKHVLEIKSIGFWKNKPLAELWEKTGSEAALLAYIQEKRPDIMFQTHACMLGTKVPRTYLLFKDRDGCAIGLHREGGIIGGPIIHFDPAVWEQACQRIATVVRHLRLQSPPPPEFIPSSYECKLCKFRHLCHDADRRRKNDIKPALWHPQLGGKLHVGDK